MGLCQIVAVGNWGSDFYVINMISDLGVKLASLFNHGVSHGFLKGVIIVTTALERLILPLNNSIDQAMFGLFFRFFAVGTYNA